VPEWLNLNFSVGPLDYPGDPEDGWQWYDAGGYTGPISAGYERTIITTDLDVQDDRLSVAAGASQSWATLGVGVGPGTWPWPHDTLSFTDPEAIAAAGYGLFSDNAVRDRLYQEVSILFNAAYFANADSGDTPELCGTQLDETTGINLTLYLVVDYSMPLDSRDWGDQYLTVGTHTLGVGYYDANTDDYWFYPVGMFTTAELCTGIPKIIRLEWRGATLTSAVGTYVNKGDYTTAADGEIFVSVDGVTKLDVSDVAFQIDYGYGYDHIGQYCELYIRDLVGQYVYAKAGSLTEQWVDVANFVDQDLDSHDFLNGEVRVVLDLWAGQPDIPVKARLYNVTDDLTAAESPTVTGIIPLRADFTAPLTLGLHTYRLQLGCETPGVDLFAVGYLVDTKGF
jgi:hypothetical protein